MKKKTFWIITGIVLAVLALLVIWQTMQINTITSSGMVGGC